MLLCAILLRITVSRNQQRKCFKACVAGRICPLAKLREASADKKIPIPCANTQSASYETSAMHQLRRLKSFQLTIQRRILCRKICFPQQSEEVEVLSQSRKRELISLYICYHISLDLFSCCKTFCSLSAQSVNE